MNIEILNKHYYKDYENFLFSQPNSLFYHSIKYKNFLEKLLNCQSYYLVAYENQQMVGALPLMMKKGPLGQVINSLPFFGSNGGLLSSAPIVSQKLLQEYTNVISKPDIISATYIENPLENHKHTPLHNAVDVRIGQFTNIACDDNFSQEIFKRISANKRNEIRRAERHQVQVIEDNDQLNFIQLIHQKEMQEKNRKYKPNAFFEYVKQCFVAGKDYKVFIAHHNQTPIAGLLLFYFNQTVEYFTPVVITEARIYQPMALILYYAFLDAMQAGYKWFNWGGTWLSQEGVYQFKKQMGAVDLPYKYYIQINNEDVLNMDKSEVLLMYPDFYVFNFNNTELIK